MDGDFEVNGVEGVVGLDAVRLEDGVDFEARPDLRALVGDDGEADVFIVEPGPGEGAEGGERGGEFWEVLEGRAHGNGVLANVLANVLTFLIWLLKRIARGICVKGKSVA